jgi:PAS domain S-box-containing protein
MRNSRQEEGNHSVVAKFRRWAKQAGEKAFHFERLNIGPRLTLCFVFIILAMLVGSAVLLWQFHQARAQAERLSGVDHELIAVLQAHSNLMSFYERLDVLAHSERIDGVLREVDALHKALLENNRRSMSALSRLPPEAQLDQTLLPTLIAIQDALPAHLEAIAALAKSRDWEAVRLRLANQVRPLESRSSALVENVDREVGEERAQALLSIEQAQRRILLIVPTTAGLTVLFAAFLGLVITRSITQPLGRLMEGSKALGRGEFQHRVAISGEDELAHLGRVFDDTAGRLRELYATLQASEDRLRLVINTIPAHVWSAWPDGSVDFISERWRETTGLSVAEGLGWDWASAVHPDDLARFVNEWHAALAAGEPMESEGRLRRADGEYRRWLIRNVPLRDEAGNIVKWYGTSIDIEDRKQAEDALRRSQAYLTQAQTLSHTGSFGWDVSGGVIYWSEETFRIFEFEPTSKVTIQRIVQRTHPQDRLAVQELIERVSRERTEFDFEHRLLMPDGSVKHLHVVGHPSTDEGGRFEFVGAVTDITERKRAEQRLVAQHTVTQVLAEVASLEEATPKILQVVCECLAWDLGELWRVDRTAGVLRCVEVWHKESVETPQFVASSHDRTFMPGIGLPGRVWSSRKPAYIPDVVQDSNFPRAPIAAREGLHAAFAFPILLGSEVFGVMDFFSQEFRQPGQDLLDMMATIGSQIGQFIERKRAEADLQNAFLEIKKLKDQLDKENIALREDIDKASMFEDIVGESPALLTVLERVAKVAPTDSTVLITGETGTGKELIARAIHKRSQRSERAFVSVNCAATPATLIASELFGHEKGAFTGALQRRLGRFELAEGGTIFLDEIGELPAETQIALLRVLQEREFQRVGGSQLLHADVRVIAATNRDLESAIAGGAFRKDLFYRLNVFPIEIPPLRERREDVPTLIEYFIHRYSRKARKKIRAIDTGTLELLESYAWPGNIRELQNVIERSVIICETDVFSVDPRWLSFESSPSRQDAQPIPKKSAAQEREAIEKALTATGGRVSGPSGAAARLNMPASTLESKIRSLKINKFRFKNV